MGGSHSGRVGETYVEHAVHDLRFHRCDGELSGQNGGVGVVVPNEGVGNRVLVLDVNAAPTQVK